jgi:hypothetical protein
LILLSQSNPGRIAPIVLPPLPQQVIRDPDQLIGVPDQMIEALDQLIRLFDQMIQAPDQVIRVKDQLIEDLDQLIGVPDQMIGTSDQLIRLLDQMIQAPDQVIRKKDQLIEDLDQLIRQSDQLFEDLDHLIRVPDQWPGRARNLSPSASKGSGVPVRRNGASPVLLNPHYIIALRKTQRNKFNKLRMILFLFFVTEGKLSGPKWDMGRVIFFEKPIDKSPSGKYNRVQ